MHSRPASRRPFRPALEALEGRALLSVCTVDRLTDLGQGTGLAGDLRYCITQAQNGDSIRFSATGTISLTGALPDLTRSISIDGPGANLLTVRRDTGGNYRIITVAAGVTVSLSGLTLANGYSVDRRGGGILNSGTLTVGRCTVSGNTVTGGSVANPGTGGGIHNAGTLTITDSTVSGNMASGGSGFSGGGIYNASTLTISNSTVSGNVVSSGGIPSNAHGGGIASSGSLTVIGATISGNRVMAQAPAFGGGISRGSGPLNLRNTVLAGNMGATNGIDLEGTLTSSGYNLIGDTRGGSGFVATDLLNVNPMLGPLQDNGGPTQTHALLPGSPAINAADPAAGFSLRLPKWDQRGEGYYRVAGGRLDIGAFEVQGRGNPGTGESGSSVPPPGFDVAALLFDPAPRRRASSVAAVVVG